MATATEIKIISHKMNLSKEKWDVRIGPPKGLFRLNIKELWRYRDLIMLFVRRDVVSVYKQTILGPLWFVLQPVLMTITFTIVFSVIAKLSTNQTPPLLFYMSGIIPWTYFSGCLNKTSNTFIGNIAIFGKVYFPRLTVPISVVISSMLSFFIQFILLLLLLAYYLISDNNSVHPNWNLLLLPVYILIMAFLGLGSGIVISAMTTKYRDLKFLVGFGVQLLMYASPVIFPLSTVEGNLKYILLANPMTSVIEGIRYSLFGIGEFNINHLLYSILFTVVIFVIGLVMFNKVEKSFTDTV